MDRADRKFRIKAVTDADREWEELPMLKIRKFDLDDLQEVIQLSKMAYEWKEEGVRESAKVFGSYTLEKYRSEPEGLFVAEENGKIVGNCFGHIDEKDKTIGWLWYIAINPKRQGQGVGSKLLAKLTEYFKSRGVKKIMLGTEKPQAVAFYEKQGFKPIYWKFEKEID